MRQRALSRLAAGIAVSLLWASEAMAALTVVPRSPYQIRSDKTIFYAGATTASQTLLDGAFVDTDSGYQKVLVDDTSSTDSDKSSMLVFDVYSDQEAASLGVDDDDDVLVVAVEAQLRDDSFVPIRIAAASFINAFDDDRNPSFCVEGSNCQGRKSGVSGLLAAKYQEKSILRIGIYAKELCESANDQSTDDAQGCFGDDPDGNNNSAGTDFPITLKIRIKVTVAEDGDALADLDNDNAEVTDVIKLHFQNAPPTITCPASFENSYFPGDGEIFLDTRIFDVGGPSTGKGANVRRILVIGNTAAVADLEGTYASNPIVSRPKVNQGAARIRGFTNGTPTTLCFGARDDAGIVAVSGGAGVCGCTLSGIESADISGFLKDSNCFIASASFRSNDASPVRLLRRFRDGVLSRFAAGRAFISAYYEHSPAAARWLLEHPAARIPVLGLLVPVQAGAWLALHPAAALGLAGAGAAAGFAGAWIRRRRRTGDG